MLPSGRHAVQWDGRNDSGELLSSGVYIASLKQGRTVAVKKMLLAR